MDAEATIASIQVERDRLALELDCALGRDQEDLHSLGAVGNSPSKDPLDHLDYGLVESGYVDDMPVRRVRKQPRRHLSDLTTRGSSHVDDFGAVIMVNTSLSDYDVPTLAEKEVNRLGSLKRAANFSNINNLDPNETFSDKAGTDHRQWESFDDVDGVLPGLRKNKFADVSNEDAQRNEGSPDLWSFTPDSIINVSTGECISLFGTGICYFIMMITLCPEYLILYILYIAFYSCSFGDFAIFLFYVKCKCKRVVYSGSALTCSYQASLHTPHFLII